MGSDADLNSGNAATPGVIGGGNQASAPQAGASPAPVASSGPEAAQSLKGALAALDRRDYSTARRLFEALGRKDAAEAIDSALAALDRKDFAAAQGLFEALALPKLAPGMEDLAAPEAPGEAREKPAAPPLESAPFVDPEDRPRAPRAERPGKRSLRPHLLGVSLALLAIFGVAAVYVSQRAEPLAAAYGHVAEAPAQVVDLVKALVKSVTGSGRGETERSEMSDIRAALAQATTRLDKLEREYGARLDKLGEEVDANSATRLAEITARLDALDKKAAAPAAESPDLAARLDKLEKQAALAPASEIADLKTRLDRLEKQAAVAAASPSKPVARAAPKPSALTARAQPSAKFDPPVAPGRVLQDYAVEDVRGGVAVVDGRYGTLEVAPGDFIPGAGRVLRIERRGGDWVVLTSGGVIASGAPY